MNDKILTGDALTTLQSLQDNSFDCCVTSPPYYGLRDYGENGQIGLEETVEEYIKRLTAVFHEVRRVLKPDGTLWLNIADSYSGSGKGSSNYPDNAKQYKQGTNRGSIANNLPIKNAENCKPKDLMGIPFILAFALRADGWYWRQVIVWEKPNAMPESAADRCTNSHEYILLFSKSQRYYFDYKAIQEPCVGFDKSPPRGSFGAIRPNAGRRKGSRRTFRGGGVYTGGQAFVNDTTVENETHGNEPNNTGLRRKRSVWSVATTGSRYKHYATFPTKLVEPCILAGSREGGTVLDPFAGTGTVGVVAQANSRKYTLIDISAENTAICQERLKNEIDPTNNQISIFDIIWSKQ